MTRMHISIMYNFLFFRRVQDTDGDSDCNDCWDDKTTGLFFTDLMLAVSCSMRWRSVDTLCNCQLRIKTAHYENNCNCRSIENHVNVTKAFETKCLFRFNDIDLGSKILFTTFVDCLIRDKGPYSGGQFGSLNVVSIVVSFESLRG